MTRNKITIIIMIALCALLVPVRSCYGFTKVGTTAANFLKIPVGARADAMAGAFVALANDVSSLYWNPAGFVQLEGKNLCANYTKWFAGIHHGFGGVTFKLNKYSALGLGVIYLNSGKMEVTTLSEPEGTGQYFTFNSICLGVSYARYLTDRFSFGITGKYIQENVYRESASMLALDLGSIFVTNLYGLRIGAVMLNLGDRMQLAGQDLTDHADPYPDIDGNPEVDTRLSTESWALPLVFKVGIALDILGPGSSIKKSTLHTLTLDIDAIHPADNRETLNLGLEYLIGRTLALRTGYRFNYDEGKLAFGAGILTHIGKLRFKTNYAFSELGRLGFIHRIGIEIEF